MRALIAACISIAIGACGPTRHHGGDDDGTDACVGMQCNVVNCASKGKPDTALSGTVFAPNGTLPLYGVNVYVPTSDPGPMPTGVTCNRCSAGLPGTPIVEGVTDEAGRFKLTGVPAGANIPLVITTGKWRRQLVIPNVDECTEVAVPTTETRMPKNRTEGDMPQIAISTGMADALECLPRKLGIDDAEIGTAGSQARIHLFADNGATGGIISGVGTNSFKAGFPGGSGAFADSTTLWNNLDNLKKYDIVMLSCEGAQHPETKTQAALDTLKSYADIGGRVFLSHWHNIWVGGNFTGGGSPTPKVWNTIAQWTAAADFSGDDLIDEAGNTKGPSFATWMMNVGGSTVRDHIAISGITGKSSCTSVDTQKAERWVYMASGGGPQDFQFTTPNEVASDQRCGKVVFSDMHVSGDSTSSPTSAYPSGCAGSTLTAQEKALAFMFFDIASCVGQIF